MVSPMPGPWAVLPDTPPAKVVAPHGMRKAQDVVGFSELGLCSHDNRLLSSNSETQIFLLQRMTPLDWCQSILKQVLDSFRGDPVAACRLIPCLFSEMEP